MLSEKEKKNTILNKKKNNYHNSHEDDLFHDITTKKDWKVKFEKIIRCEIKS
jgi:hypothetical protein